MDNPNELMDLWNGYKKYIDEHPDIENVVTVKGNTVKKETKKPYLKQGFESYVFREKGFSIKDYLSGNYAEFSDVVTCIRNEWEEDQISGTITGKYKAPNLVARLNGLVEKSSADDKSTVTYIIKDADGNEGNNSTEAT